MRQKNCRVCSYEEYLSNAAEATDVRRKKYWYNLATAKKCRVLQMCLRPSRSWQSFCNEDHFTVAQLWQQQDRKASANAIGVLRFMAENADEDITEAKALYHAAIMMHIDDPKHEEVLKFKKMWKKACASKARRNRELNDALELQATGGV